MALTSLTGADFQQFLDDNEAVVIDVWAKWCMPCREMESVLENIEREFDGVAFAKLDGEEWPTVADRFEVRVSPTLLLFRSGALVSEYTGGAIVKDVRQWIRSVLPGT